MDVSKVLAASAVRRKSIKLAGESVLLREPGALQWSEYRDLLKSDKLRDGFIYLLGICVINEDGTPALDKNQLAQIVDGSNSVIVPLVDAISDWATVDAKKV